jgi:hypothetical protein
MRVNVALADELEDRGESPAGHAAEVLLDRGWGKTPQRIGGDPDGPLIAEIVQRVSESKP